MIEHTGIIQSIRNFRRDHRGVSAVEFAVLLPIMLTLYLGGSEITQAITIKRKTTLVTRAIGDLVAQDVSITNAEMTQIMSATTSVMAPYGTGTLKIKVSSVTIDNNGNAKVAWSDAFQDTARAVNETVTLPTGLNLANTTLIWAEASYTYTPPIGYAITGSITMQDKLYLRPRLVNTIARVAS
jgi:Flp pilus assembly protein TadG